MFIFFFCVHEMWTIQICEQILYGNLIAKKNDSIRFKIWEWQEQDVNSFTCMDMSRILLSWREFFIRRKFLNLKLLRRVLSIVSILSAQFVLHNQHVCSAGCPYWYDYQLAKTKLYRYYLSEPLFVVCFVVLSSDQSMNK